MRVKAILGMLLAAAIALVVVPAARADYAVLRSGMRLHITGYVRQGDQVELTVEGGTVEIAASDLVAVDPEDTFTEFAAPPAPDARYRGLIQAAAKKHGVDEKLITRVIAQESNFNPQAVSPKQALGLMQLLRETAARYDVANVFDPAQNIDAGTHYLKDLLVRYGGNLALALAAYNAGPDVVDRYGGVPPIPETQNYVRQILTSMASPHAN